MKKNAYSILVIMFAALFSFSACSDWFDISPKTNVKAEELFSSESGYMEALAGLYVSLTDGALYGENLSFGMVDQMAGLYTNIPDGASDLSDVFQYTNTTSGGFNTKGRLADSWQQAYFVIANANNLIKWLDKKGKEVIIDAQKRRMLYGEALAIRAYLHFDLLRGWGPLYQTDADSLSIPYRTEADNSKKPLLPAKQVAQLIIHDLTEAKKYLAFEANTPLTGENESRRFRFNYHAVNAELARVYCYVNNKEEAIKCAKEVINNCGLQLQITNQNDPVLYKEMLCGVNLYEMEDNITSKFSEGPKFTTQYRTSIAVLNSLFESTGTSSDVDMRCKSAALYRVPEQKIGISRKYINNVNEAIPLIRLPEMYYILCEMSDLKDAPSYLNTVRNKRGYSVSANVSQFMSNQDRINKLYVEYRKEFYAEGQCFWFLKNHNFTSYINSPVTHVGRAQYIYPLPDREQEYGWTAQSDSINNK